MTVTMDDLEIQHRKWEKLDLDHLQTSRSDTATPVQRLVARVRADLAKECLMEMVREHAMQPPPPPWWERHDSGAAAATANNMTEADYYAGRPGTAGKGPKKKSKT